MQRDPQLNSKGFVVQIIYSDFVLVLLTRRVLQSSICSAPEVILVRKLRLSFRVSIIWKQERSFVLKLFYSASAQLTAAAGGVMSPGCPYVRTSL